MFPTAKLVPERLVMGTVPHIMSPLMVTPAGVTQALPFQYCMPLSEFTMVLVMQTWAESPEGIVPLPTTKTSKYAMVPVKVSAVTP